MTASGKSWSRQMTKPVENLLNWHNYRTNGLEPPKYLQDWLFQSVELWALGSPLNESFKIFDTMAERWERRNIELRKYAAMLGNRTISMKAKIIGQEVDKIRQGRRDCDEQLKAIDKIAGIPGSEKQKKQLIRILQGGDRDI